MNKDPELRSESRFAPNEATTPSESVIKAVAEAEGCDPLDSPPLYEVLDPDALDALFRGCGSCRVGFEYAGYEVVVRSNGRVVVREGESGDRW